MRVLAVNDISCVGKCSLSVSLPLISACGVTCDVLPTALLSTHTGGFEGYTFRDLTDDFPSIMAHWKTLDIRFDVLYSGYLGSEKQIDLVLALKKEFLTENGVFIVDPVMGDNGQLYAGFTDAFVEKMRGLCKQADYILPNETEAALLSALPYPLPYPEEALEKLKTLCARPIITGVEQDKMISVHYADNRGVCRRFPTERVAGFFPGSGDIFASVFVGALARGESQERAVALAAEFTTDCIKRSATEVEDKRYGLNFEKEIYTLLKKLNRENE